MTDDLLAIYLTALEECDPARLVREAIEGKRIEGRVDVVALGKCAAALFSGAALSLTIERAFVGVPHGYARPHAGTEVELAIGSHPDFTDESFDAGRRLLEFVRSSAHPIVFLISGGASASIEFPLEPWFTRDDLVAANRRLIRFGLPIEQINVVRKHLSAIKGGRLAALAPVGSSTFIHSDVPAGRPDLVGSGPTIADPSTNLDAAKILEALGDDACARLASLLRLREVPETIKESAAATVIADNRLLIDRASHAGEQRGYSVVAAREEIAGDVARCAATLYERALSLAPRQLFIAGGEPTVRIQGDGRGGRCSELALRLAAAAIAGHESTLSALFGSSDGVDGNSGTAGAIVDRRRYASGGVSIAEIDDALARSDSAPMLDKVGGAIIIPPTGNNLRDLYILARG